MDELDVEIHLVKEGVVISRDSKSSEKFVHGIKVLMAKNYIDNLSEEARKGQLEKAEQGIWPTKAPLGYRFLAWNGDERYVVASRGRIRRETTWVPLEKVQSVRWVQGPVQRWLGLASVHLDVAGRRTEAAFVDRDEDEAHGLVGELVARCRVARSAAPAQPRPPAP